MGTVKRMEQGDSWRAVLARMSDAELDELAADLTETLSPDDPMIVEVRYWLRRIRDEARDAS